MPWHSCPGEEEHRVSERHNGDGRRRRAAHHKNSRASSRPRAQEVADAGSATVVWVEGEVDRHLIYVQEEEQAHT